MLSVVEGLFIDSSEVILRESERYKVRPELIGAGEAIAPISD